MTKVTERFDFFILVKWVLNVYCCRRNLSTSLYANSVIGVGMASTMYHISRGEARKYTRWGDYAMIAASTLVCTILPGPEQRGVDQISFISAY
jgi:predicted membrane channel-forming protein YqfA (hemolysin III family)